MIEDVSDVPPTRRMSVVRGTLIPCSPPGDRVQGRAEAAAAAAVQDALRIVPGLPGGQVTHVDVLWNETENGIGVTVTVQGFARRPWTEAALLGATAALLVVRATTGTGSVFLEPVQDTG